MCINRDVEELLSIWPGLCTFDRLVIWGKLKMRQTRRRLQRPKIIVESEVVLLSKPLTADGIKSPHLFD